MLQGAEVLIMYLALPWSKLHTSLEYWELMVDQHQPDYQPESWTRKMFPLSDSPPKNTKWGQYKLYWLTYWNPILYVSECKNRSAHSADPLCDCRQVDFLPRQSVSITLVDVVGIDLGAPAVFGALPGHSYGQAITTQHGNAVRSTGSCWKIQKALHLKWPQIEHFHIFIQTS